MTKENKIWLYKGELVKIFFREFKIKRKFTMAIKRHMTKDVYKRIAQANFGAALHCTSVQLTKNMEAKKEYRHCTDYFPSKK